MVLSSRANGRGELEGGGRGEVVMFTAVVGLAVFIVFKLCNSVGNGEPLYFKPISCKVLCMHTVFSDDVLRRAVPADCL